MAFIKNDYKLEGLLTDKEKERIDYGAMLHRRHSRIFFEIITINTEEKTLVIKVHQEKSPINNYVSSKGLKERTLKFFMSYFKEYEIYVHAIEYGIDEKISWIENERTGKKIPVTFSMN